MSGIVGMFYPGMAKPIDPARIVAMRDAIAHRGPDGSGVWCVAGVGLGHRRLASIDPAGGVQPLALPDQRLAVILDGTLYNYREVRAELTAAGAHFTTESDAEVLLHGWRAWGAEMLPRLNGMFAFALYDAERQSLFLARDRLGVKPLHYGELPDGAIAFASELKGLLAHPMQRRAADIRAVEDYLALGYVPDDACLVAGVQKLAAGHFLLLQRGRPVPPPVRWWDIDFSRRAPGRTRDLKAELLERMRAAVRTRMVSDVPVGALLTGSVESAGVVALMAEHSKAAVKTCAIEAGVGAVAERFATRHQSRSADAEGFALVDTLVAAFDEPFADAAAIEGYRLCQLARETMAVALAPDGADAAFAGSRRVRRFARKERLRALLPADLRAWLFGGVPALRLFAEEGATAYARQVQVTSPELRARLFTPAAQAALDGHRAEARIVVAMRAARARSGLDRAQAADIRLAMPGSTLTKLDRTSMAVGLEARDPMLDPQLVEFVATLPESLRMGGQGRGLMRTALQPWLPGGLLPRQAVAVAPPLDAWFRGPLAEAAVGIARSPLLQQTGWFDLRVIATIAEEHRAGKAAHGALLWQLLMLERAMRLLFA